MSLLHPSTHPIQSQSHSHHHSHHQQQQQRPPFESPSIAQAVRNFLQYRFSGRQFPEARLQGLLKSARLFLHLVNTMALEDPTALPSSALRHSSTTPHPLALDQTYMLLFARWKTFCFKQQQQQQQQQQRSGSSSPSSSGGASDASKALLPCYIFGRSYLKYVLKPIAFYIRTHLSKFPAFIEDLALFLNEFERDFANESSICWSTSFAELFAIEKSLREDDPSFLFSGPTASSTLSTSSATVAPHPGDPPPDVPVLYASTLKANQKPLSASPHSSLSTAAPSATTSAAPSVLAMQTILPPAKLHLKLPPRHTDAGDQEGSGSAPGSVATQPPGDDSLLFLPQPPKTSSPASGTSSLILDLRRKRPAETPPAHSLVKKEKLEAHPPGSKAARQPDPSTAPSSLLSAETEVGASLETSKAHEAPTGSVLVSTTTAPSQMLGPETGIASVVPVSRDIRARQEEAEGIISFHLVANNGELSAQELVWLVGAKNLFARQLKEMPKEYISRLVFDSKHRNLLLMKEGRVAGAICYRPFEAQGFAEVVFVAISSSEQVKGYGTHLMSHLKALVIQQGQLLKQQIVTELVLEQQQRTATAASAGTGSRPKGARRHSTNTGSDDSKSKSASSSDPSLPETVGIRFLLTYADNSAVLYFQKQGFSENVTLDKALYVGYIKDYQGAHLMQCTLYPTIPYLDISGAIRQQRRVVEALARAASLSHVTRKGVKFSGSGKFSTPQAKSADDGRVEGLGHTSQASGGGAGHTCSGPQDLPGVLCAGYRPSSVLAVAAANMAATALFTNLRKVLRDVQAHESAWPFLLPVNPKDAPNYNKIIAHPMDLKTMEKKLLERSHYKTKDQFLVDLKRIFSNCRQYNLPESQLVKCANALEQYAMDKLSLL